MASYRTHAAFRCCNLQTDFEGPPRGPLMNWSQLWPCHLLGQWPPPFLWGSSWKQNRLKGPTGKEPWRTSSPQHNRNYSHSMTKALLASEQQKKKERQSQSHSGPYFPGTSTLSVSLSDRTPPWYHRHKPDVLHLSKSLQTPETLTRLLAENGFLVEKTSEFTKSSFRIEAANTVLRPKLTSSH